MEYSRDVFKVGSLFAALSYSFHDINKIYCQNIACIDLSCHNIQASIFDDLNFDPLCRLVKFCSRNFSFYTVLLQNYKALKRCHQSSTIVFSDVLLI